MGTKTLDPKSKITSLEGCPNTLGIAKTQLEKFNLNSVQLIATEFSNYLNAFGKQQNWKLIYFDGNHSKKATLAYFEILLSTATNDSVWIFDDIHWSKDMEEAWKIIQNHPKVTVTIDTFQWGLVFFRQEQMKEHFIINPKRNLSSYLFKKIRI